MIELTPEQRQAINQEERPPRAFDAESGTTYVLIREEVYERARGLLSDEASDQFVRDLRRHSMRVFGESGWDDPAMDVYNDMDPRRQP
jgi:hypothetical protein